jgi:hypothetical protein
MSEWKGIAQGAQRIHLGERALGRRLFRRYCGGGVVLGRGPHSCPGKAPAVAGPWGSCHGF